MLFYTGIKRTASQIASTYVTTMKNAAGSCGSKARLVQESLAILTSK